jgi:predicted phosphodiesterase
MEQRKKYLSLFKEKGVDVVFAGHTHQDYDAVIEGIHLVTAGPVCNALGHGMPGYNVVKVVESGVEVNYTPTPGVDPSRCVFK